MIRTAMASSLALALLLSGAVVLATAPGNVLLDAQNKGKSSGW